MVIDIPLTHPGISIGITKFIKPAWLRKQYLKIVRSIAFFPSILSIGIMGIAFILMSIEYQSWLDSTRDYLDPVLIKNVDNARVFVSSMIGGLIALTVFSFSMVMMVLNRASVNLTPRLIPGLIQKRANQFVLGFYIGCFLYCLVILINIQQVDKAFQVPSLGLLFLMILAGACMALFVFFINSISESIQTEGIIDDVYKNTIIKLKQTGISEDYLPREKPNTLSWFTIDNDHPGYLKHINFPRLSEIADKCEVAISIEVQYGVFLPEKALLCRTENKLSDNEQQALRNCFTFFIKEYIGDHYSFGMKMITEVGIKSLSPSINDPNTAKKCIDLLSILLIEFLNSDQPKYFQSKKNKMIWLLPTNLNSLMDDTVRPFINYGCNDTGVIYSLTELFISILRYSKISETEKETIALFITLLKEQVEHHTSSETQKKLFRARWEMIRNEMKLVAN